MQTSPFYLPHLLIFTLTIITTVQHLQPFLLVYVFLSDNQECFWDVEDDEMEGEDGDSPWDTYPYNENEYHQRMPLTTTAKGTSRSTFNAVSDRQKRSIVSPIRDQVEQILSDHGGTNGNVRSAMLRCALTIMEMEPEECELEDIDLSFKQMSVKEQKEVMRPLLPALQHLVKSIVPSDQVMDVLSYLAAKDENNHAHTNTQKEGYLTREERAQLANSPMVKHLAKTYAAAAPKSLEREQILSSISPYFTLEELNTM